MECVVCTGNYEDVTHILFNCTMAVNVWKTCDLWQIYTGDAEKLYVETIIFSLLWVMTPM